MRQKLQNSKGYAESPGLFIFKKKSVYLEKMRGPGVMRRQGFGGEMHTN